MLRTLEEYQAAQDRGEVEKAGGDRRSTIVRGQDNEKAEAPDLGIDRRRLSEIRKVARAGGWPALESAVEQKIADQIEFVRWWRETVTPNKGGDRRSDDQSPRSATLVEDAEALTGITKQQVSKWSKRLQDQEARPPQPISQTCA